MGTQRFSSYVTFLVPEHMQQSKDACCREPNVKPNVTNYPEALAPIICGLRAPGFHVTCKGDSNNETQGIRQLSVSHDVRVAVGSKSVKWPNFPKPTSTLTAPRYAYIDHVSHSLNSLKGSIIWDYYRAYIKGDTRSLDYGSCDNVVSGVVCSFC